MVRPPISKSYSAVLLVLQRRGPVHARKRVKIGIPDPHGFATARASSASQAKGNRCAPFPQAEGKGRNLLRS